MLGAGPSVMGTITVHVNVFQCEMSCITAACD